MSSRNYNRLPRLLQNSIEMWYDRVEQILGDELGGGGTSGNRNCYRASSSVLNISTACIPLQHFSNAEGTLAASGVTPVLVNLENRTEHPDRLGQPKLCPMESQEGDVLFCTYR